jgi:hypothetical protein
MLGKERYDDEHRIFLQGLMCKGILNFKENMQLMEVALVSARGAQVQGRQAAVSS